MFQKTAASFDECSTAGVFLSTLHCPDYRSELLFPADIQTLSSGEPPELPDLGWVEMTDLKGESSAAWLPGCLPAHPLTPTPRLSVLFSLRPTHL